MDAKTRDRYIQKKYGKSLAWYNQTLAEQGGGCAICGKKPKEGRALHIDHDHKVSQVKVRFTKVKEGWLAEAEYNNIGFVVERGKKADASEKIRSMLKAASVRGLLDWKCNAGLQKWRDNPALMRVAAGYLERFQNPVVVQPPSFNLE